MSIIDKSEPWKVKRSSWHYKFYKKLNPYKTPSKNFCNYFWSVTLPLIGFAILGAMLTFLIGAYIVTLVQHTRETLLITGGAVLVLGVFIGFFWWLENKKPSDQPNLVGMKIHSVKEKYCPAVEYVD